MPRRGGATGTGNTVGITADTIKISLIATDLSQLAAQNLAPEIGNAGTTMQAVTDDINAKGGIAGRKVELIPHVLAGADAILNPDLGRQACIQATEDDKPFAVIIAAAIPASVVQCVANDHDVLTITMDSWPESLYTNAKGRLFSVGSHISIGSTQLYRAWPRILDDAGLLKGKKIGIIRQDVADQQEETDQSLKPGIAALGYKVAAEAVLPCPEGSQTCDQHQVAIQRMQDAGVDFVFLVAQTLAGSATVEAAQTLGYKPQWATVGNNVTGHGGAVLHEREGRLRRRVGPRHRVHRSHSGDRGVQPHRGRRVASRSSRRTPTVTASPASRASRCRRSRRRSTPSTAPIDQASVIAAIEQLEPIAMITGPAGLVEQGEALRGHCVFLSRYSAKSEQFEPVDDRKPIKVGG